MKAINKQTIVKTIIVLFATIIFQSCSSSNEKYTNYKSDKHAKTAVNIEDSELSQEELEQAAALLLLAAVVNEMDNSANETYYEETNYESNDSPDYDGKDYDKGTEMIRDRIETEIGSQIVYE